MHYNSVEHFLTANTAQITDLLTAATREVDGWYASLSPEAFAAEMAGFAQKILGALSAGDLDRSQIREEMRDLSGQGRPLDDLRRVTALFDERLLTLARRELVAQPELAAELARRVAHLGTSFRTNVTAVDLDNKIRRLGEKSQKDSAPR